MAVVRGYLVGRARTPVGAVHGLARITSCFPLTTGGAGDLLALQPMACDGSRVVVVVVVFSKTPRKDVEGAGTLSESRGETSAAEHDATGQTTTAVDTPLGANAA